MISFGASLGNSDERMYNAGLTFKLGMGNHISTSRTAMAEKIVSLEKDNAAMKKDNAVMKEDNAALKEQVSGMQKEMDLLKQKLGL